MLKKVLLFINLIKCNNLTETSILSLCIIEDYLEPVIDESGSGQMVLKQGKAIEKEKDIENTPVSGIV